MDKTDHLSTFQDRVLLPATAKALVFLSAQDWLRSHWYLAGGTALALQCGHRRSVDLDFFTPKKDVNSEQIVRNIDNGWITTLREKGTLYGELFGVKLSFISYPFFQPKEEFLMIGSVQMLHAKDVAVMKIIAVSQRGKKRDFYDLYWYVKNKELLFNVIDRVKIQYPNLAHNFHHILKSLVYFEEAEQDPDPEIFFTANWSEVKNYFLQEVSTISKSILNLE